MSFELTPEQRDAVRASDGTPLHIHDTETQKVFLLIEQGEEPTLEEGYIRQGLQLARQQIEDGKLGTTNIEEILVKARQRRTSTG